MDTGARYSWLNDPAASRRRSRRTAERLVTYSKTVLDMIKKDIAAGIRIDPAVVKKLEETIARHEPDTVRSADVSDSIDRIMRFGRERQR